MVRKIEVSFSGIYTEIETSDRKIQTSPWNSGYAQKPAFARECPIKTLFVMHPSHCEVFGGGMP